MPTENDETQPPGDEVPVEVEDQKTVPTKAAGAVERAPLDLAEEKIAALEKEKKETHERLLRTAADFDNFRKRSRKEAEDARQKGMELVLRDMLPVVDNLERALASMPPDGGPVVEGVRLVLRQLLGALERLEVKSFVSVGEPFDPARHEAIQHVETAERPPGTVHVEMQKGYLMGARLLRPAMVGVAKAPAGTPAAIEPEKTGTGTSGDNG
jgi:molecular chaperone GrpE